MFSVKLLEPRTRSFCGGRALPGWAPTLTTPTPTGQGVARGSLHCPAGGESVVTLRFDQNRPGPLVPGDRRQLGGAEVVRSCPRGLGRGGGWPPTSPSRGAVRAECPSALAVPTCSPFAQLTRARVSAGFTGRGGGTSGSGACGNPGRGWRRSCVLQAKAGACVREGWAGCPAWDQAHTEASGTCPSGPGRTLTASHFWAVSAVSGSRWPS